VQRRPKKLCRMSPRRPRSAATAPPCGPRGLPATSCSSRHRPLRRPTTASLTSSPAQLQAAPDVLHHHERHLTGRAGWGRRRRRWPGR
jgi:hypothetical protein